MMEAPEKIYLHPDDRAGEEYEAELGVNPLSEGSIEYTRTDAFIEKACLWLKEHTLEYVSELKSGVGKTQPDYYTKHFIEDFKTYMEE